MAAAVEVLEITQYQAVVVLCMVAVAALEAVHILRTLLMAVLGVHTPLAQVRAAMAPMAHREHLAQAMVVLAAAVALTSTAAMAAHHPVAVGVALPQVVAVLVMVTAVQEDEAKSGFGRIR